MSSSCGLMGAWLIHDAEELATMSAWSASERSPISPMSNKQVATAISLTGCVMAAASEAGRRTVRKSKFYQAAFGLHSLTHVALSVISKGCSPGILTIPTVVIPAYVSARRTLKDQGIAIPNSELILPSVLMFAATVGISQLAATLFK